MGDAGTVTKTPTLIPRPEHIISRANISKNALKVLYRLKESGYDAYLVGGGVRDLLLGREPKDFDVATNAHPDEVHALFRNSRLIGRRFRLVHVQFGREIVEVSTFRALLPEEIEEGATDLRTEDGRILRDNVYGTIEEDAWRRDFTINALYYNIEDFSVVDYVGGVEDLRVGMLRMIGGDPERRYREDPVRMLRAVRFAAKLGFRIHPDSERPLQELGHLLAEVPPARLFDEILKLFLAGQALPTFELLRRYRLFGHLFPLTEEALAHEEQGFPITFVARALANTDARVNEDKPVTPAFLFAALLWEPVQRRSRALHEEQGVPPAQALQRAASEVLDAQVDTIAIPRRFSIPMRDIWALQPRFTQRRGRRPLRLLEHPRFRAAYDFLALRAEAGEALQELVEWWTELQGLEADERERRLAQGGARSGKRRGRRKRRRRGPGSDASGGAP
ncbi:MAG: polynucleotide adenylyltransferase PcnB [Gammaproteobacteria bacterium]|nr:polynucleotide adenylyltransferase PcnB [Gammaproteobacteria bacterium]